MKQPKNTNKIWLFTFGALAVVICAQLVASNILAGQGEEAAKLEIKSSQLLRTNQALRESLARQTSLTQIAQKAQDLGFIRPDSVVYVDLAKPVAALP